MTYIRKRHLSRRMLLRGAGAAIALPLLDAMVPAATAQSRTAAAAKLRMAAIYIPHGAVMDKWTPATEGTGFKLPATLEQLEPYRNQLNVISNLRLPLAYGSDASAGANHTRSSAVWLTAAAPAAGRIPRMATSVDQLAAKAIGQDTPMPSLELAIEGGDASADGGAYRNTISWQGPESPLPMQNNPQVVFERLFGEGGTQEERTARRAQSRSLLDSVTGDIASLKQNIAYEDRNRLDRYLTDVREIERRIGLIGEQLRPDLDLPPTPVGIPTDFDEHIQLMFDLQVLAWQAEITRITTMMMGHEVTNATYPNSGINDPFHNLSHHSYIQANIDKLAILNKYHLSKIVYLLEKLRTTPEADGNLLDRSLILYGSGMSNSNQHDHDPLPIVLIGGAAGKLKGGRHIMTAKGTPLSNLQLGMLDVLGVHQDSFGDSTGRVDL
jgi:hypothetical protein